MNLIKQFEDQTGLTFNPNGPDVAECPHCSGLLQFIGEHECFGLAAESLECAYGGFGVIEE